MRITPTLLAMLMISLDVVYSGTAVTNGQTSSGPANLRIEGFVLDESNKPIPNVLVRAYLEDLTEIGRDASKANGMYSISFRPGAPIGTLRYDLSGWDVATVTEISGNQITHN